MKPNCGSKTRQNSMQHVIEGEAGNNILSRGMERLVCRKIHDSQCNSQAASMRPLGAGVPQTKDEAQLQDHEKKAVQGGVR
jgi:hypothetical protein